MLILPPPSRERPPAARVGTRPALATIGAWKRDATRRTEIAAYVASKGPLRVYEAVLCALWWIERHKRHKRHKRREQRAAATSAAEVEASYPVHGSSARRAHRVRGVAGVLRRLARFGLVERAAEGWYRTTALGGSVVEALPDRGLLVAALGARPLRTPSLRAPSLRTRPPHGPGTSTIPATDA
jgi:hypothetical protein